jgi:hypothetical protein
MAEDEKLFTQADVDRVVSDRLKEERARRGDNEALIAENTGLKASLLSEQTTRQALEAKVSLKEETELKAKIAKEVQLPEGLIQLIPGKTEDEIRTAMKVMVSSIGPGPAIGAETNPATSAPVRYTRAQVNAMKPEDITKNWSTIEAQLADGSLR